MGGGGPKVRTGIAAVDSTVNNAVGAATLGTVGNSLDDIGENLEKNGQMVVNNAVGVWQPGGLNNFGNSVLQNHMAIMSGGMTDNNDIKAAAGESGMERKAREGAEKAVNDEKNAAAEAVATAQAEALRQVESSIAGIVDRRKRSPGKALTLLGSGGTTDTNTLLDIGKT